MRALVAGLVMAAAYAASPAFADNAQWCAENRNQSDGTRANCADSAWCKAHWNDDRISRMACDPFRSRANLRIMAPSVTLASLRNLSDAEKRSQCSGSCFAVQIQGEKPAPSDPVLVPTGVANAKLAIRADIFMGTLPAMVVKIGIQSADSGTISVNTARGSGPRYTVTARLKHAEVGQIVAALDKSRFWQLPKEASHQGAADGEMASIQVSIPGHQHHVTDFVGRSPEAVDLSILARTITTIVFTHWKSI